MRFLQSIDLAKKSDSGTGKKDHISKLQIFNNEPDTKSKIELVSRWMIKSAIRKLGRIYRQNNDDKSLISYEGVFKSLSQLFGA